LYVTASAQSKRSGSQVVVEYNSRIQEKNKISDFVSFSAMERKKE
jgi:hypothetical protein